MTCTEATRRWLRLWPRAEPWVVGCIVLLGLLVRLPGFRAWWLNPDEGIYYSLATWPEWSQFWSEVAVNAHPPLFYLVTRGMSFLSLDFAALRAPSLVCGVLAIAALYLATRELAGAPAALLAGLLVALSEAAIVQSQVTRPYTMQLVVLGLLVWFLARYTRRRSAGDLIGLGASMLVAVLLHYSSVLVAGAAGIAAVGVFLGGGLRRPDLLRLGAAQLPALAAAAILWFAHVSRWLVGSAPQVYAGLRADWLRPFFHDDLPGLWAALCDLLRYWFGTPYDVAALAALVAGLGLAFAQRRLLLAGLTVASLALAAVLSLLELYPFGASRHSTYLMVTLLPCMAAGLSLLLVGPPARRLLAAALLAGLVLHPAPVRRALGTDATRVQPAREQVTPRRVVEQADPWLRRAREAPSLVIVDRQTYFLLMPYFHAARAKMQVHEEAGLAHFPWGAAVVLMSQKWQLRVGPRRRTEADHLLGFLRAAGAALPELELAGRPRAYVLFGGWGSGRYGGLRRSARGSDRKRACVLEVELQPGFGWARLDPSACLASLTPADPPAASGGSTRSMRSDTESRRVASTRN